MAKLQNVVMGGNLLQFAQGSTRFNCYGYSVAHIKTSIPKGYDTMIGFNIRGYMYGPQPVDTDVAFYCYAPVSYVYGVSIYQKSWSGWSIGMYYSSDNYVCFYVDGMSTYGGFSLNWVNTSLISWGDTVTTLDWVKANTTSPQF